MIKRISIILFLTTFCLECFSQQVKENNKLKFLGDFGIDFGFSTPFNAPDNFNTAYLGSRTFNVYYLHEITLPINKSRFSILPGLGLGLDRFTFSDQNTLYYEGSNLTMSTMGLDITKSQLITNYLDIPVELRYTRNPQDPNRSLKVAVGFRFGYLFDAFTKIKYYDENTLVKDKSKRDWNLNSYRYGVYGKIGIGNFSIFSHYNFSTLFRNNSGPDDSGINVLTTGISISGF